MSQSNIKSWERPWNIEEMIENASNWSLAGDSGLLQYLEDFSEKMLSRVKDTSDQLNDLIDKADETSLALQNATNQFMGLHNTQFIESRVYEDDETLPTKQTPEKDEKLKQTDSERLEEMKKAICNGLEIIDKYYEKVEIPESDSEDDTDELNILYQPVDPYIDRPLPYVIGSRDWYVDWQVGLGHSSSNSDSEDDQFSETESEQEIQNLPARDRTQIPGVSDSESEDLPKNKMSKPVANSTFNDNTNRNMFESSSGSESGSLPPQVNTVNSNFAEELAAKLGKVESANIQPEVNTKPIKKQPSNIAGGLFSDEPPPLDDDSIFEKKNINSGLFSGGDNLFDDVDDDSDFWNVKGIATKTTAATFNNKPKVNLFVEENDQDLFSQEQNKHPEMSTANQTKKPVGLFDEDDDDLFSTVSLTQPKKTILAPLKTTAPLVSEEPPELEPVNMKEEMKKKKPVGGVSVLGPNALLQQHILKNRQPSSSESDYESELVKDVEISKEEAKKIENSKVSSIFDDTSPLFSDDIFNTSSSKLFTSKLFDTIPSSFNDDIFKERKNSESTEKEGIQEISGITPDLITESNNVYNTATENTKPKLFLDEPPPLSQSANKKSFLFDNDDDIDDDLFSTKSKTEAKNPQTLSNPQLFPKSSESLFDDLGDDNFSNKTNDLAKNKSKLDLFDPNPPELEESDNKSESQSQFSLDNESVSYGSMNVGRALLFDTEPPVLSNESSGIVKDQSSTRFEGEDSSFYPYLTSSRRLSDPFQDQSDSLLTGENKLSVAGDSNPNLSRISENETITKIDITPSGNESSLFNNSLLTSIEQSFERPVENDLFKQQNIEKQKDKPISLFGNAETNIKLFKESEKLKPENTNSSTNIFTEDRKMEQKNVSLFQDSDSASNLFKEQEPDIEKKKNISLFQDSDSDDDDLFSNKSSGSKNSNASDILNNSSIKPVKTLKNKNIFEDDLFSGPNIDGIPDVGIFNKNKNLDNSSDKFNNTKNVIDKNDELFAQNKRTKMYDNKKFNYEENLKSVEVVKTDPKKSLSFEKNVEPENKQDREEDTDGQILSTGSSPGKLKHNLNINVVALLPGASPPRRQHLEKSASLDSSESNQNILEREDTAKSSEKIAELKPNLEKSISFDQPIDTGEILVGANKERVKIPVRRRPSTRKARQEAIRKSAVDLNFEEKIIESDKNINKLESPSDKIETQNILNLANNNITEISKDIEENKIKNPLLNPLSPSTDEEDFLPMPREKDLSSENFKGTLFGKAPIISPVDVSANIDENKKNINTVDSKAKSDDLFGKIQSNRTDDTMKLTTELFDDTNDIFVIKKQEIKTEKTDSSIFSSSDSENDLFNTPKTNLKKLDNNNLIASPDELDLFKPMPSTTSAASKTQNKILIKQDSLFEDEDIFSTKKFPPKSVIIKKSLFDDEDDNDDDIFGGSSSLITKSNTQTQSSNVKKTNISSKVKKLSSDTVQDIDDPLEALKK